MLFGNFMIERYWEEGNKFVNMNVTNEAVNGN